VDQSALADYTKVIPNLIDFATIRSKLGTGNTYVSCVVAYEVFVILQLLLSVFPFFCFSVFQKCCLHDGY
jgi:hypothetical protein